MTVKLVDLAQCYELALESHIDENLQEIERTLKLHPNIKTYAAIYDSLGYLTDKTILAHGVHLTDEEVELLAKRGTSIAHCPNSNTSIRSGMCDVKRLIENGIRVGLGTDISAGYKISILDVMRDALAVSLHLYFMKTQTIQGTGRVVDPSGENQKYQPLTYKQGFFLATLGGARALDMEDEIGNFCAGKDFDALLIEMSPPKYFKNLTSKENFEQLLQKFVYTGDDRNILKVFVHGKQVK